MTGICTECNEPCTVIVVDFGIGAYEYWGAPGVDSQPDAVSDCCEADVRNEDGVLITLRDLEGEFDDWPEWPDEDED